MKQNENGHDESSDLKELLRKSHLSEEEIAERLRERKKTESSIKKVLKDRGLYEDVMKLQIEGLAIDRQLVRILFDKIVKGEEPCFELETQNGSTYKQINPLWSLMKDFRTLENQTLTKMGMNVYGLSKVDSVDDADGEGVAFLKEMCHGLRKIDD